MDLKRNIFVNGDRVTCMDLLEYYPLKKADIISINNYSEDTEYKNLKIIEIEKNIITGGRHEIYIENIYCEQLS